MSSEFQISTADNIVLVTAFGVGWATPSMTEMIEDEKSKPCLGLGIEGHTMMPLRPFSMGFATPWTGLAALHGQLLAMRNMLPHEFHDGWDKVGLTAYDSTRPALEKNRSW